MSFVSIADIVHSLVHFFIAPSIIAFCMPVGIRVMYGRTAAKYQKQYCSFISASFICIKIFAVIYYYINIWCGDFFLISTGLLLTIFLIVSGVIINKFYNTTSAKSTYKTRLDQDFVDKTFIIGSTALICAIDFFIDNSKISCFLISIVLGKYFWIDFGLDSYKNMRHAIVNDWDRVSYSAKNKSIVFAILVLLSDYSAFFADKYILHLNLTTWSTIFSVVFCILYLLRCCHLHNSAK